MTIASFNDKELVVNILTASFADNKSVNYIVKQDSRRQLRVMRLMEYSFDTCNRFGEILLSNDKKACALILFPDKKRTTLQSIISDIKLIIGCMGLLKAKKAMTREAIIRKIHPSIPFAYLWFIGVHPAEQNKGIGSALLKEVIEKYYTDNRAIYLETSTEKNLPWYKKYGFKTYSELDFGYRLYCMKNG